MTSFPSLIAFGSLGVWPSAAELKDLRTSLLQKKHLSHIREAVSRLPELWDTLLVGDAALEPVNGRDAAAQLSIWVSNGGTISRGPTHQNVLSLPLTILRHLCSYMTYVEQTGQHSTILNHVVKAGGVQGFCAGLLSALAVAGSRNEEDIGLYGAVSVRLAFAIGAYVDLDSLENGQTNSLALRWKSPTNIATVEKVLEEHNMSYIAVLRDTNNATITVPLSIVSEIARELSSNRVDVLDTGLTGRYHTLIHQGVPEKVLVSCQKHGIVCFGQQHVVRSNMDGDIFPHHDAARLALRDILLEQSNWHSVISEAASHLVKLDGLPFILAVGPDAIPQSISKNVKIVKTTSLPQKPEDLQPKYPTNAIAIIGMSCKFPGADSPDEFWKLLINGTAMLSQVPPDRWPEAASTRSKGCFWGNFMSGVDFFDHRFFKKSSREAASMDPQQRLLLQGAYEAMESSGYFSNSTYNAKHIGCYLGLCATDYDANVGSHAPNAFSTLGTLRAFLSGKISHFFGWSGPSVTIDTACSSSAVAIHTACRALQADECTSALAGGVALFTSPYLFENLAAAHFLSPTGATKPFDAKADGYCRGEGIGLVVLKKLSVAEDDGDNILAVIGGSAVNQNDNRVPITVPSAPSQGTLYHQVVRQAGVSPHQVSFIEAHGTGTPVGDPIEMESIRTIFGGPKRDDELVVSSVKGNIGHLEGASGVAGLIKSILQIENRTAALQASFQSLNPKIPALNPDRITIPTSNLALPNSFLTACINNYGAAGSNSAMLVMEPPRKLQHTLRLSPPSKYPILIAANSSASIVEYCKALKDFCHRRTDKTGLLGNIAFNLAKRQNQGLPYTFVTVASDMEDLKTQLTCQLEESAASIEQRPSRPSLVLTFGGQVRDYVGMSIELWQQCALVRFHLDHCDKILRSMNHTGLYPAIFQSESIADVVTLHSAIFALQYATAKAWIDSGLVVDAVIGHSLGQLTALSVSGVLSVEDGLKFVSGRASLMKTHWGPETGAMIAVEIDLETLSSLSHSLEVACYNGPSSHVLVGDKAAVDDFEKMISNKAFRYKRLNVKNGFHSKFTEPLISPLKILASSLRFNKAIIPIETCSDAMNWPESTSDFIAEHTRNPVFFCQAVQRLASSRNPCTWLEVGSDSSVIGMVRRALNSPDASQHGFLPINLGKPTALDMIVDTTMQLWKRGHNLLWWNFHALQRNQYESLRLPSYQFEKHRHWLELASPAVIASPPLQPNYQIQEIPQLVRLIKQDTQGALFNIDPSCEEYQRLVSGHVVAGSPLCPATMYMEMAARASTKLLNRDPVPLIGFSDLRIDSPLGLAADGDLTMTLRRLSDQSWTFNVASQTKNAASVSHALGTIKFQTDVAAIDRDFGRYERLTGPEAIEALYRDPDSESIQGPLLYKLFSRVVEYGGPYRGLKSVAAKNCRAAGTVISFPESVGETTLTWPPTVDSFMQVAGIHANSIYPCPSNEVYVFTKLDYLQFGAGFEPGSVKLSSPEWIVFSNLIPSGSKELANDIFVFDSISKRLVVLILGARFNNVRLTSLAKVLSRVNNREDLGHSANNHQPKFPVPISTNNSLVTPKSEPSAGEFAVPNGRDSIFNEVCILFEKVADVPRGNVKGDMFVEDLGIDSLMMLEVISEISTHFTIQVPVQDMENLSNVDSLVNYLQSKGCGPKESSSQSANSSTTPFSSRSSHSPVSPDSSRLSTTADSDVPQQFEQLEKLLQEHLELASAPNLDANLVDLGLDSLLSIELGNDIEEMFSVAIDLCQLDETSTFRDLARLAKVQIVSTLETNRLPATDQAYANDSNEVPRPQPQIRQTMAHDADLPNVHEAFEEVRLKFDNFSEQEGFTGFWSAVYPDQKRLVLSYIAEAFKKLGSNLASIPAGYKLPNLTILAKQHLLNRLHKILADGGYIEEQQNSRDYRRTTKPLDLIDPQVLLRETISKFPLHAAEHRLLNVTGSRLAECLTGEADPLTLLFANKANRQLLADVYDLAPMCRTATRLLADFLLRAFSSSNKNETFHILEVGGGTGGTSKFLVEFLTRSGVNFTYTFTDISSALVSGFKKSFAGYDCMRYATLDCDEPPRPDFIGKFHALVSTNCIHATHNATTSLANIRQMLRPDDGFLALVEFTNGMYWFDLVYGLLDGWWLFSDGRRHALGGIPFWERSLLAAGYKSANWTSGDTPEAETLQLICGFNSAAGSDTQKHGRQEPRLFKRGGFQVETLVWKQVDDLELSADVYYPSEVEKTTALKRPIALLFHGGGHVLFTRKDIPIKHIKTLLDRGFLPVSVDYRLCPEVKLAEGPITDACDALVWARQKLPQLQLERTDVRVDGDRIVAVGWSSGGHLAMTLGYSSTSKNILPPEAILAFYCPSNLEDEWWKHPIYPKSIQESPSTPYDLLEGVGEKPISGYIPNTALGAPMTLKDPRWRIIIHYNWKAQLVPILVGGLPSKSKASAGNLNADSWTTLPMPSLEDIQAVSPYAQIVQGSYGTPTFMVHGDRDDLIPWQQTRDTIEALQKQGVDAGFAVPKDAGHAFDLWSNEDPRGTGWVAMLEGYDFICRYV